MSTSGVNVSDECVRIFNELKTKSKYKYAIFKLNDSASEIVPEKTAEASTWDEFIASLPANDCRYVVYDFEHDSGEGIRKKIIFILWSPDTAKVRSKMIYASSDESMKKKIEVGTRLQANDFSDLEYNLIVTRLFSSK